MKRDIKEIILLGAHVHNSVILQTIIYSTTQIVDTLSQTLL